MTEARGAERRRARRFALKLRGRFLLPDGGEHPCETLDVSVTGLSLTAPLIPNVGERLVVYLDELGRVEGVVVSRSQTRFALGLKSPSNRMERMAHKLAALSGEAEAACRAKVAPSVMRPVELTIEFGPTYWVEMQEQEDGARIRTRFALLPGARVAIEGRPGVVMRDTEDGFVVSFGRPRSR